MQKILLVGGLSIFLVLLISCSSEPGEEAASGIEYEYHTEYHESENCVSPDSNCAYMILEYPILTTGPEEEVISALNDTISAMIKSCALDPTTVDSIPDVVAQFLDSYDETREEFEDYRIGWNQQISIDVRGDLNGILCLGLSRYEFTGGAHPLATLTFKNFDLRTGMKLQLSDILVPGMRDSLIALATPVFRAERGLNEGDDLGKAGFWFENGELALTDNVCIGDDGLTFFYNPYEIAPYSLGPTEVFLSYDLLVGVVESRIQ